MTVTREGWLDGRPFSVDRDPETGESLRFICLDCDAEIEADAATFERHDCETYREGPELRVTDAARELAADEGLDLSEVEGSGAEGRITKADVQDAAHTEE